LFLYFSKNGNLAESAVDSGVSGVLGISGGKVGGRREAEMTFRSAWGCCEGEGERDTTLFLSWCMDCAWGDMGPEEYEGEEFEFGERGGVADSKK
jgi:hypothetical protein